jgi:RNA polymerase sigma-70 factor (ECF subfamily)
VAAADNISEDHSDDLYAQAIGAHGDALNRLARAYEFDAENRRDLLQEIHLSLWRSFSTFDSRCSLRTWVYRVAHNTAASHILRSRRSKSRNFVNLEEIEAQGGLASPHSANHSVEHGMILDRLLALIQRLNPLDRQVILLYLEGMDAASIAEVTGISPGYVATKIHRIKSILAEHARNGGSHEQQ